MHFQISFVNARVADDQRFAVRKDIAEKSLNRLLLLLILRSSKFHTETPLWSLFNKVTGLREETAT